ncbi:MAG: zf-HC2 domain-containing protein [Gemmatimonadota bacterium]|nr:zf-HC2 domain-containing protein [Gemmatimonadota bacterium]
MESARLDHDTVDDLLGAYADGELPESVVSRVAEHLRDCRRCRMAVAAQAAARDRLASERPEPASPALRERISAAFSRADSERSTPNVAAPAPMRPMALWRRPSFGWLGWAVAAGLAALLLVQRSEMGVQTNGSTPAPTAAETKRPPMVEEALADYRRQMAGELPLGVATIADVRAHVPFPVVRLVSADAQLLGAWTTRIRGNPAAVLAYRWRDRVILQYVVPEAIFFRQPQVRQAVAAQGRFVTAAGSQSVVAWPNEGSGSLLIGDAPPVTLATLQ